MGNQDHLEILRNGPTAWNQWRQDSGVRSPDLSGFDLRHADLRGAFLENAVLYGTALYRASAKGAIFKKADLRGANLIEADLSHCNMISADLREADLLKANLTGADLRWAKLRKAYLGDTNLTNANCESIDATWSRFYGTCVTGASLRNAKFGRTILANVDFSTCKNLESVNHQDVSSLGLDTISKSGTALPVEFFRACGFSIDQRTALLTALSSKMLQSCFISYAEADRAFAFRLRDALNARGVDYWFAPDDGIWGRDLTSQLKEAIDSRDRVILICGRNSLNESDWVQHELSRSIQTENDRKAKGKSNWRTVFPVILDKELYSWEHKYQPRLTEILAADFSTVLRETGPRFEEAVNRLVRGLEVNRNEAA